MFGFLLPMRRFRERIASLGCTVLDLMMSEISRLSAISSLSLKISLRSKKDTFRSLGKAETYRLEDVAVSICASRAVFDELNQPAMVWTFDDSGPQRRSRRYGKGG